MPRGYTRPALGIAEPLSERYRQPLATRLKSAEQNGADAATSEIFVTENET